MINARSRGGDSDRVVIGKFSPEGMKLSPPRPVVGNLFYNYNEKIVLKQLNILTDDVGKLGTFRNILRSKASSRAAKSLQVLAILLLQPWIKQLK